MYLKMDTTHLVRLMQVWEVDEDHYGGRLPIPDKMHTLSEYVGKMMKVRPVMMDGRFGKGIYYHVESTPMRGGIIWGERLEFGPMDPDEDE
jgi:hypothetical protein